MADPTALPPLGPGAPTPPIALAGGAADARPHLGNPIAVPDPVIDRLRKTGAAVSTDAAVRAEASRDWWPAAMIWATEGEVGGLAGVVVTPADTEQVAAVLRLCNAARVPVTTAGGRSGVCGASVPVFGGVVLDTTALTGVVSVDEESMLLDVRPGTFGDHLEQELRNRGLTVGHWPQSIALSTVGGWVACRGAGQLSNRYGKIEDMVVGLDVVLADGTTVTTGGGPRAAVGPDLTQLLVGSEGTLGVITGVRLRLHPAPVAQRRAAFGFGSFAAANDACRRVVQRGLPPAVLRVYDAVEADRSYQTGDRAVLLVLDEGDPVVVDASMAIVDAEVGALGAEVLDEALVDRWLSHRNDVAALEALIGKGYVVDTMEISAPWSRLEAIYDATTTALRSVPGVLAASAHQSHAYPDGACLYFTFAGAVDEDPGDTTARDRLYAQLWDTGQRAVLAHGGTLSHHHGVGLNRGRFMAEALGAGHGVLRSVKDALDPNGILNPGKLGLPSPFGEVTWP